MSFEFIALMRGINVGGKNRILMKDLKEIFLSAGATEVETFIQSGNVLFNVPGTSVDAVIEKARASVQNHLTNSVPIVMRSEKELHSAIENNPFIKQGVDEKELHLMFLEQEPLAASLDKLERERFLPDEYALVGRDVYLRVPKSLADTKLSNSYFDSRLKTTSTGRNWRTVLQLRELMQR